jgi:hypothetical protein
MPSGELGLGSNIEGPLDKKDYFVRCQRSDRRIAHLIPDEKGGNIRAENKRILSCEMPIVADIHVLHYARLPGAGHRSPAAKVLFNNISLRE